MSDATSSSAGSRDALGSSRRSSGTPRAAAGFARSPPRPSRGLPLAHDEGWTVRIEGRGTWLPPDAPADLAVSTRGARPGHHGGPADLVATVAGGRRRSARCAPARPTSGVWLAFDPPGRPRPHLGSIVATATAGPLRHGFGPVRDHLLGCTFVTGDGRLIKRRRHGGEERGRLRPHQAAGRRLRRLRRHHRAAPAPPRAARGPTRPCSPAAAATRSLGRARPGRGRASPRRARAAFARPGRRRRLGARGRARGHRGWRRGRDRAPRQPATSSPGAAAARPGERVLAPGGARGAWAEPSPSGSGPAARASTTRSTCSPHHLDEGWWRPGRAAGMIRWTGDAPPERLRTLRRARRGPRDPPDARARALGRIAAAVGHFGAYREGVGALVAGCATPSIPGHVSGAAEGDA